MRMKSIVVTGGGVEDAVEMGAGLDDGGLVTVDVGMGLDEGGAAVVEGGGEVVVVAGVVETIVVGA